MMRPKEGGKVSELERVEVEVPSNLDLDLDFLDMLQIGQLYRILFFFAPDRSTI